MKSQIEGEGGGGGEREWAVVVRGRVKLKVREGDRVKRC
jgi:hypothetical protein